MEGLARELQAYQRRRRAGWLTHTGHDGGRSSGEGPLEEEEVERVGGVAARLHLQQARAEEGEAAVQKLQATTDSGPSRSPHQRLPHGLGPACEPSRTWDSA
jgi:hypothetical protein